jgi:hypothetical protein
VSAAAPAQRRNFDAQDFTIAIAVALLAQLLFVLSFSLPSPKLVRMDITDDNAKPIAVAITPVLKLGSKNPTATNPWQRKKPVAAKSQGALPSPQAEKTPEAIPSANVPDASVAPVVVDAGAVVQPNTTADLDAAVAQTASSTQGSEQGAATGTETDPLKARAADMYRAQLASWFVSRFNIKGKIPFDKLKTLHATAMVTVTPDRRVGSFSVVTPSGDPTFDAEVKSTLASIQAGGAELPAPPPNDPDMLGKSLPVGFQCTVQKYCE